MAKEHDISRRRFLADAGKILLGGAALGLVGGCKTPFNPLPEGLVHIISMNGQVASFNADGNTIVNLNPQTYGDYSPGRVAVWTLNGNELGSQLYASYWGGVPGSFTPVPGDDYAVFVYPPAGVYQKMDNNATIQMAQSKRFHSVGYKNDEGVTPPADGVEFWAGVINEANGFLSANGTVLLGRMDFNSSTESGDLNVGFGKKNYNDKTNIRVSPNPQYPQHQLVKGQIELSENNTNMDDVLGDSTMHELANQYFYGYTQAKGPY